MDSRLLTRCDKVGVDLMAMWSDRLFHGVTPLDYLADKTPASPRPTSAETRVAQYWIELLEVHWPRKLEEWTVAEFRHAVRKMAEIHMSADGHECNWRTFEMRTSTVCSTCAVAQGRLAGETSTAAAPVSALADYSDVYQPTSPRYVAIAGESDGDHEASPAVADEAEWAPIDDEAEGDQEGSAAPSPRFVPIDDEFEGDHEACDESA